jgi:hypothetical protein
MSEVYRIPRLEVPAQLAMVGRQVRSVNLYLGERAKAHPGPEKPSDLLNAGVDFIPALERGNIVFVNLENVLVVSVPAEVEFDAEELHLLDAALAQSTHRRIQVVLDEGTPVRGDVTYLQPEGRRRLQDFLNIPQRFMVLRDGALARLVNKRRVAWVTSD